jgi:hypothetical protein
MGAETGIAGISSGGMGGCFTRPPKGLTPYERIVYECNHDEKWAKEITLGKRVAFYRFKSDIGHGNFSQVKSAVHQLTKGDFVTLESLIRLVLKHKYKYIYSHRVQ